MCEVANNNLFFSMITVTILLTIAVEVSEDVAEDFHVLEDSEALLGDLFIMLAEKVYTKWNTR